MELALALYLVGMVGVVCLLDGYLKSVQRIREDAFLAVHS